MKSIIVFIMSLVFIEICGMDIQKEYSRWVKNASALYVYSKKGTLCAEVPVTDHTSVWDVKRYLEEEGIVSAGRVYFLNPLYNSWYRLGYWQYATTKITGIFVKDAMQKYNTQSVWIDSKPISVTFGDDADKN